ncbi:MULTISPECIES: response regulator [Microbacterium]|jgi:DNA-binding NarL/FixJ family response regulator|uniref:Response regulator transcription factor n=1 Tax=Microbacterium mcarthurae TaxID=3035918 RepID=A0ABW9GJJ0_9MICO|nr:response regulator transcription factor [Microbacterium sp. ACRRU]MCG7416904.1 response regulator transcription factor [Microbacterium sp. ACRRU]
MGTSPVRALIVDDEALVRSALRVFLQGADDIVVVGEASDGDDALQLIEGSRPDVVLMDVQMPRMNGVEATTKLKARFPAVHVIALTTFSSESALIPMLRAGASGFLVKDTDPDDIVEAVRQARDGEYVLSRRVTSQLVSSVLESPPLTSVQLGASEQLTPRERDVVELLAQGKSNAEIAKALFLSEATVKAHLGQVMAKWGVRDRVQALIRAVQAGIVTIG